MLKLNPEKQADYISPKPEGHFSENSLPITTICLDTWGRSLYIYIYNYIYNVSIDITSLTNKKAPCFVLLFFHLEKISSSSTTTTAFQRRSDFRVAQHRSPKGTWLYVGIPAGSSGSKSRLEMLDIQRIFNNPFKGLFVDKKDGPHF